MLTKKQKRILDFIKKYIKENDYSPTLEEIKRHFRLSSVSGVHQHVEALKNKGYLQKEENQPRAINVFKKEKLINIPLLGLIAAGQPIEAIAQKETISVPQSRLPLSGEIYALRVVGNSMIDENINDGDIILVKNQNTAENGQKVVALIDNNDATLKKYYKEYGHIRLQPANKNLEPIIIQRNKEFLIQGIVIDTIKGVEPSKIESLPEESQEKKYLTLPINKIICGDATMELNRIPDNSVDLILTDPPYGISRELNCKNKRLGTTAKLNFNFGPWDKFNHDWFEVAAKKTKGWIMTFCAKKDIGTFWNLLEKNKFIAIDTLVWQKPDPLPLNAKSRFLNAWEAIVAAKKPGAIWNSSYAHNIIKIQAPKGKDRVHPTQKPVGLIKKLIELTTKKEDIVLDPFIGSGTTAIAAKELGRYYIGFEISKEYCKIAEQRVQKSQSPLF